MIISTLPPDLDKNSLQIWHNKYESELSYYAFIYGRLAARFDNESEGELFLKTYVTILEFSGEKKFTNVGTGYAN